MRVIRKATAVIIGIVMIFSCTITSFAAQPYKFNLNAKRYSENGNKYISLTLATDIVCGGVQGTLSYDKTSVTYVTSEIFQDISQYNNSQSSIKDTEYGINIILLGDVKSGTEGEWVTFIFKVNDNAMSTADFSFTNYTASDLSGNKMKLTSQPLTVSLSVLVGDVNGNDNVDIKDLVRFKKFFAGELKDGQSFVTENADCNNDLSIDTADVTMLIKYLLGISSL